MSLCEILYSPEYAETMAELRDSLERKEYSLKALDLTAKALGLLASHYTTWHYRFSIVQHLGLDLFGELDWCEEVALDNEKNYQIWNYRQLVVQAIVDLADASRFDPHREYPIMAAMLDLDPKNHHVWSYRKWLVETFELYDDAQELRFVESLIDQDVRNNSAWTHRFFLKFGRNKSQGDKAQVGAEYEREMAFARDKIDLCPQNPSAWNYLRGVLARSGDDLALLKPWAEQYADFATQVQSSYAVELLAEIAEHEDVEAAQRYYRLLAEKYDPIRANYWSYRAKKLTK